MPTQTRDLANVLDIHHRLYTAPRCTRQSSSLTSHKYSFGSTISSGGPGYDRGSRTRWRPANCSVWWSSGGSWSTRRPPEQAVSPLVGKCISPKSSNGLMTCPPHGGRPAGTLAQFAAVTTSPSGHSEEILFAAQRPLPEPDCRAHPVRLPSRAGYCRPGGTDRRGGVPPTDSWPC